MAGASPVPVQMWCERDACSEVFSLAVDFAGRRAPPHVYVIANSVYDAMRSSGQNQSVVVVIPTPPLHRRAHARTHARTHAPTLRIIANAASARSPCLRGYSAWAAIVAAAPTRRASHGDPWRHESALYRTHSSAPFVVSIRWLRAAPDSIYSGGLRHYMEAAAVNSGSDEAKRFGRRVRRQRRASSPSVVAVPTRQGACCRAAYRAASLARARPKPTSM